MFETRTESKAVFPFSAENRDFVLGAAQRGLGGAAADDPCPFPTSPPSVGRSVSEEEKGEGSSDSVLLALLLL